MKEGGLEKARTAPRSRSRPSAGSHPRQRATSVCRRACSCSPASPPAPPRGGKPDEGAIVETAFHKFPAVFAYAPRPEFPDVEAVRVAVAEARANGLLGPKLRVATEAGRALVDEHAPSLEASASTRPRATKPAPSASRSASRPRRRTPKTSPGDRPARGHEGRRAVPGPPAAGDDGHAPDCVCARVARTKELRRIDRGDLVDYLLHVAEKHNPDVIPLLDGDLAEAPREGSTPTEEEVVSTATETPPRASSRTSSTPATTSTPRRTTSPASAT